jgi:cyclohexanone monooxygenase
VTSIPTFIWNEKVKRWFVATNRGDEIRARYTIIATGPLSRPRLPGIPGIDDFEGRLFHTSRWDYDYTGGDNSGNLHRLVDRTVAVVGTGATAVQCVPHLARWSKRLYVVQRTPSTVDLRLNQPTDPDWVRSLKPGWQAERRRNYDDVCAGKNVLDHIDDAITRIFKSLRRYMPAEGVESLSAEDIKLIAEYSDGYVMNGRRARVDKEVKDPKIADILKPWYRLMCKRPTYNDDYLATFNRPNVSIIDTSGHRGLERITPNGIIANGVEHKVDCIIFATGFDFSNSYRRRIDFEILGRNGESLFDHWADGPRTFHGFPNWIFIGPSQNGLSFNFSSTLTVQSTHAAHIIKQVRDRGATCFEPTARAVDEWGSEVERLAADKMDFYRECTPGAYNNEGQIGKRRTAPGLVSYGPGPNAFEDVITKWRNDGKLEGLDLS